MRFIVWVLLLLLLIIPQLSQSQDWQIAYDSASAQLNLLRYHTAKPWAERALKLAENQVGKADTNYARILDVLAETETYLGEYNDALQHSQAALAIWERTYGKRHLRFAYTLQTVAESYQYLIQYPQAEARHLEALQLIGELAGKESVDFANALNRMVVFYRVLGLLSKAIVYGQQTIRILEQVPHRPAILYALALKNLGELHSAYTQELIEPDKAIGLLQQAKILLEKEVGRWNIIYAETLRSLSRAYYYRKSYLKKEAPEEKPLVEEALTLLDRTIGRKTLGYIASADWLSTLYRREGNLQQALNISLQNLTLVDSLLGSTHPDYVGQLFDVFRLYVFMGQYQQAEPLCMQVNRALIRDLRLFSDALDDNEREQLFRNSANGFIWLHSYARLFRQYNPAVTTEQYNTQLAIKGFLLHATRKLHQRLHNSPDSTLRQLYTDWLSSRESLSRSYRLSRTELTKRHLRLDSLETGTYTLEKQLIRRLQATGQQFTNEQRNWQDVRKALKPGEAAIEIVRYRTYQLRGRWGPTDTIHYTALIVTPTCAYPKIVYLENGNDLEGPLLVAYRNDILNQTNAADSYRQYWKPISDSLQGIRRVYLSLDGVYNQINISTLRNPTTGQYALDEREIVLVTTTNDLLHTGLAKPITQSTAVLIGYPDYGPSPKQTPMAQLALRRSPRTRLSRDGFYEPLPATKQEVADISQLLQSRFAVRTYTRTDAREEIVKMTNSPTVLHIATHGFFETDTALGRTLQSPLFRSGLVLAGANRTLQDTTTNDLFNPNRREDGILTAYEAMNLNLDQTELVVLSACQTGLGEVRNGEGVYGLQRAFKIAGANSLLMSLWKVDDDVTRQLMTTFYRNWLQTGDKVRAFRLAQQTLRKKYPQPFYWGAFVLVGQ